MFITILFSFLFVANLVIYFVVGNTLSLFLAGMLLTALGHRIVMWSETL